MDLVSKEQRQNLNLSLLRKVDCACDLTKSNQLEDKLHALSKQVEEKLERDLIITGSRLTVDEEVSNIPSLPPDLYFYYDSKHSAGKPQPDDDRHNPPVPSDPRFQQFGDFLMDVVIGSASIYQVFPFRPLKKFHDTLQVDIIDGGRVCAQPANRPQGKHSLRTNVFCNPPSQFFISWKPLARAIVGNLINPITQLFESPSKDQVPYRLTKQGAVS